MTHVRGTVVLALVGHDGVTGRPVWERGTVDSYRQINDLGDVAYMVSVAGVLATYPQDQVRAFAVDAGTDRHGVLYSV